MAAVNRVDNTVVDRQEDPKDLVDMELDAIKKVVVSRVIFTSEEEVY